MNNTAKNTELSPTLRGPVLNQGAACEAVLRALPQWFGIESAILQYRQEIDELPTFMAQRGGQVVGFLTLKQHNPYAAELYVMGVLPECRGQGLGRALLQQAETYLRAGWVEYFQVKTLGPSDPDENYAATRGFYQAHGFRPLEEIPQIWGADNPCLILVKRL